MHRYLCKSCGAESPAGIGYVQLNPGPLPDITPGCPNPHVTEPPPAPYWRPTHPANVRVHDITPAGPVTATDVYGSMRFAVITVGGVDYRRTYDAPGWLDILTTSPSPRVLIMDPDPVRSVADGLTGLWAARR